MMPVKKCAASIVRSPRGPTTDARAERDEHGRQVGRGIRVRDVAADRPAVSNRRIADQSRRLRERGRRSPQVGRCGQLRVRRERADAKRSVADGDAPQLRDAADVDDRGRRGEPAASAAESGCGRRRATSRPDSPPAAAAPRRANGRGDNRSLQNTSSRTLLPVHRSPHPLWRHRHLNRRHAERLERIDHRVVDRARGRDRSRFADALHAERMMRRWRHRREHLDVGQHVGARNRVVASASR